MAEETRIIKIEIDQTQALKDLESTEVALLDLKNQQKELNDQLKAGTVTQNEYAASKVQLDNKIKSETDNRKTLTQAINTESNSLAAQKLKLKELVEQRDKIDRSTVEGAKKFDDMNKSILSLNTSIKSAEQQGGSFQRNVGNYKGTIDQFTGGAYSAAEGLGAMVKASLAFIATPIGAIIAAVGLALGALMAYFKGSEEGQNNLNKIMTIGSTIMEKIMDIVEDLGEAIFNAFSNPKQALIDLFTFVKDNLINRFTAFAVVLDGITSLDFKKVANGVIQMGTGVENTIDKVQKLAEGASKLIEDAIKEGGNLANMEARLDRENRERTQARAKRDLDVSLLRRQADEAEGQEKLDHLNAALELEAISIQQEVDTAQLRRDIAAEKVRINGDDKDALDQLAKAEGDLFTAQRGAFDETRKMNKERIATEKAIRDEIMKRTDADQKLEEQETDRVNKANAKADAELSHVLDNLDKEEKRLMEQLEVNIEAADAEGAANQKASDNELANYIKNEDRKAEKAAQARALIRDITFGSLEEIGAAYAMDAQVKQTLLNNEMSETKKHYNEKLTSLQDNFDKGLITEEQYNFTKEKIQKESAQAEFEIKKRAFETNKKNQIAQIEIDIAEAVIKAFLSLGSVPLIGQILAFASAGVIADYGVKQINAIKASQFSGFSLGGYTGAGGVNDPAGLVHKGEVVWNQRDVAMAGGPQAANALRPTFAGYQTGGIVAANSMTNQIDQNMGVSQQAPPVYLDYKEFTNFQKSMAQKVQIVEA